MELTSIVIRHVYTVCMHTLHYSYIFREQSKVVYCYFCRDGGMILKVHNNQEFEEWKSIITSKIRNSKAKNLGRFNLEGLQSPWLTKPSDGRNVPGCFLLLLLHKIMLVNN